MDELNLWVMNIGGEIKKYAFGPEWVAMALYMDDCGKDTPEDAVLDWYHGFDPNAHKYFYHHMTDDELLDWFNNVWRKEHADGSETTENNSTDE